MQLEVAVALWAVIVFVLFRISSQLDAIRSVLERRLPGDDDDDDDDDL